MTQGFSQELWETIEPVYRAILHHPFVRGLTDGSLPEPAFRFYVLQDALYLQDFARSLAIAAAKAPADPWSEFLAEQARVALVDERALHASFIEEWGLTQEEVEQVLPAPTNLAYTSYLLRVAYAAPFGEGLGALLPCFWIYWQVGKALEAEGSPNPLYQRWIDTYASEAFGSAVGQIREIMDQSVADLPETRRAPIRRHFVTTSRYEWMFWDAAWRQESWPLDSNL